MYKIILKTLFLSALENHTETMHNFILQHSHLFQDVIVEGDVIRIFLTCVKDGVHPRTDEQEEDVRDYV